MDSHTLSRFLVSAHKLFPKHGSIALIGNNIMSNWDYHLMRAACTFSLHTHRHHPAFSQVQTKTNSPNNKKLRSCPRCYTMGRDTWDTDSQENTPNRYSKHARTEHSAGHVFTCWHVGPVENSGFNWKTRINTGELWTRFMMSNGIRWCACAGL